MLKTISLVISSLQPPLLISNFGDVAKRQNSFSPLAHLLFRPPGLWSKSSALDEDRGPVDFPPHDVAQTTGNIGAGLPGHELK
jgi:hypothetical protein